MHIYSHFRSYRLHLLGNTAAINSNHREWWQKKMENKNPLKSSCEAIVKCDVCEQWAHIQWTRNGITRNYVKILWYIAVMTILWRASNYYYCFVVALATCFLVFTFNRIHSPFVFMSVLENKKKHKLKSLHSLYHFKDFFSSHMQYYSNYFKLCLTK